MIIRSILIVITSLLFTIVNAQVSQGGKPFSWHSNDINTYNTIELVKESRVSSKVQDIADNTPFEFAELIPVNITNTDNGTTSILSNGDKVWQVALKSEGAYSLNFSFSKFYIPDGAEVFIYSPDKSVLLGAFTSNNHKESGILAVAPIAGDELVIEYYEPKDAEFEGVLEIEQVGHDYLNVFGNKDGQFGQSGDCNIDINCTEGDDWQLEKRSVCRMIINNSTLCTGTLVNNAREDATPYFLSANHCVNTQALAQNTLFYFNYESPTCNGTDGSVFQSISGADLVATKNNDNGYLDFVLLKLSSDVPSSFNPYFAGWQASGDVSSNTTCIHHPWGDVKKISVDNDSPEVIDYDGFGYDEGTFWLVEEWDAGTTEQGSSGSALFDQNHRVIGTLTGGEASCGNSVNDIYQMFSVAYNKYDTEDMQLQHWLDPDDSGITFMDGYAPYGESEIVDADVFYHWNTDEDAVVYLTDDGYVSGNNAYGDLAKAEFFSLSEFSGRNIVTGGIAYFGVAEGNDTTDIEMILLNDVDGEPGTTLGSTTVKLSEIKSDVSNFVTTEFLFDTPITIDSDVYLAVVLPTEDGDTVAILNSEIFPDVNTAWELSANSTWYPYSSTWLENLTNYLGIQVGKIASVYNAVESIPLLLYPNPTNSEFTVEVNDGTSISQISIYNTMGRLVYINSSFQQNIDVSGFNAGLYVVKVETTKGTATSRLIITR